jgi:hypothetical protein
MFAFALVELRIWVVNSAECLLSRRRYSGSARIPPTGEAIDVLDLNYARCGIREYGVFLWNPSSRRNISRIEGKTSTYEFQFEQQFSVLDFDSVVATICCAARDPVNGKPKGLKARKCTWDAPPRSADPAFAASAPGHKGRV